MYTIYFNINVEGYKVKAVGNYKLKYNFESNPQPIIPIPPVVAGWKL